MEKSIENLWKKAVGQSNEEPLYVDLFGRDLSYESRDFAIAIIAAIGKHDFHGIKVDPAKSNERSMMFRDIGNKITKPSARRPLYVRNKIALELYNQSLMFADAGTKIMILAYAKRAECFFKLELYDKCLKDIQHASAANDSATSMKNLIKLQNLCLALKQKYVPKLSMYSEAKLDIDADENFPAMANVLSIKKNDEFGRYVEAKCDIDVGKTILVEKPFIAIGMDGQAFCATCMKTTMCFIPCPKCTDVVFCNEECMNRNKIHEKICGLFCYRLPLKMRLTLQSILMAVVTIPDVDELIHFVENIVMRRSYDIPTKVTDARSTYGLFLNLHFIVTETFSLSLACKVYCILSCIPWINALFDSPRKRNFLMHLTVQHTLIKLSNCYFGPGDGKFSVSSLSCVSRLFNHSCAPNAFKFINDESLLLVTIRPVKRGDQLFVSYVDTEKETTERQAALKKYHGFVCKCEKCFPHGDVFDNAQMMSEPFFESFENQRATMRFISSDENRAQNKQLCIDFLSTYGHLPWCEAMDVVTNAFTKIILQS